MAAASLMRSIAGMPQLPYHAMRFSPELIVSLIDRMSTPNFLRKLIREIRIWLGWNFTCINFFISFTCSTCIVFVW